MNERDASPIGFFQKYLTVWVILCMAVGICVGKFLPQIPEFLNRFEYARVSIPMAILIWVMIYPMMMKVDFRSIKNVERFVPRWKQANCAVAGPLWIDTTFANKGIGVQCVCRTLGIDPAQVMAFGDNYNDETMLDVVGVPYIMDNAAAPLRAKYKNHTPRPEDVLAQLLAQQP